MSRVGNRPIPIPKGVKVTVDGTRVEVEGPKGRLTRTFHPDMTITLDGEQVVVKRPSDSKTHRALHGTTRAVIANMVKGVHEGFTKELELVGVGYRASVSKDAVTVNAGFAADKVVPLPPGVEARLQREGQSNLIVISGPDKELVGEVAARIRALRPPEPYKGKGIRYRGERIRMKAGKAAAGAGR